MRFLFFTISFSLSIFSLPLPENFHEINLTKYGSIYKDKAKSLTIQELLQNPNSYTFEKLEQDAPSFGYISYPIWFKISLVQNYTEKKRYVFSIPNNSLDYITIFEWNESKKEFQEFKMGDMYPFFQRPIEHTDFAFFIELEKNKEKIFFIKFQSTSSLNFIVKVYEEESFYSETRKIKFLFGIYYGFMIGMILYNLFLAFRILESIYFLYVAYIGSLLFLLSTGTGHTFEYLWQNATEWNSRAFGFFNGAVIVFSVLFVRSFLRINSQRPFLNLLLISSSFIGLGFAIYSLFGSILLSNKLVNFFSLLGMFVLGLAGILSLKHEPRLSKFFLVAWGIFLFSSFFVILRLLGFLPRNFFTYYGTQLGSAIEALLLSFALADKIKQLQKEKDDIIQQKLKLQIQVQENLEREIQKRSEELQKQNLSLQRDLEMARKIQSKIFPSGSFETEYFLTEVLYLPRDKVGGDFYSIHYFSNTKLRVFLADATGHGVQAALITMTIKSEYDSLKEIILDPAELLENLYHRFFDIYEGLNLYFSSFLADLDIQNRKITYASVGHPNQYILYNKKIIDLERTASLFGVTLGNAIANKQEEIFKDGKLILFTDGIYEEFDHNKEQYGELRLKEKLIKISHLSPKEICQQIYEDIQTYSELSVFFDDATMIVIQIKN